MTALRILATSSRPAPPAKQKKGHRGLGVRGNGGYAEVGKATRSRPILVGTLSMLTIFTGRLRTRRTQSQLATCASRHAPCKEGHAALIWLDSRIPSQATRGMPSQARENMTGNESTPVRDNKINKAQPLLVLQTEISHRLTQHRHCTFYIFYIIS